MIPFSKEPKLYIMSAQTVGLKGKLIPWARHLYMSIFNGLTFTTFEITEPKTVYALNGNILNQSFGDLDTPQMLISNRHPGQNWFDNVPKIEFTTNFIDLDPYSYPNNKNINLIYNNCNRFVSYLVYKYQLPYKSKYIGFRSKRYWKSFFD